MAYIPPRSGVPPSHDSLSTSAAATPQSTTTRSNEAPGVKPLEFKTAMRDFSTMFPTLDSETIETVLRANNGAVDATIDQLLEMCDSFNTQNPPCEMSHSHQSNHKSSHLHSNSDHFAMDNVDSYNMHLASVTPPKHDSTTLSSDNFYANLPFQEKQPATNKMHARHTNVSTYAYETAVYKFNSPVLGPLKDDFLRIRNDDEFDEVMRYSRQKKRQVDDIKNERLKSDHYINEGAVTKSEFGSVGVPFMDEASPWPEPSPKENGDAGGGVVNHNSLLPHHQQHHTSPSSTLTAPIQSTPNPATGAIPKNFNKSWSGSARSTISTFGKKLTLRKNSNDLSSPSSTLGATSNLGKIRGYTPSTMNLLGDCDDEDDENGEDDDYDDEDRYNQQESGFGADDRMISPGGTASSTSSSLSSRTNSNNSHSIMNVTSNNHLKTTTAGAIIPEDSEVQFPPSTSPVNNPFLQSDHKSGRKSTMTFPSSNNNRSSIN